MNFCFNPLESQYKNVLGAVEQGENLIFNVTTTGNNCSLFIKNDDINVFFEYKMHKTDSGFTLLLSDLKVGLYFYYFCVDGTSFYKGSNFYATKNSKQLYQLSVYEKGYETPNFLKGGVIYQIFPDRFCNLNNKFNLSTRKVKREWGEMPYYKPNEKGKILNNDFFGGNFKGIASKLDYLKSLGVTLIYLNPISLSFSNHRYDTADYLKIDNLLGTEQDFKQLCEKCHEKGIKIMLDGVYNHTGDDSIYFNKYSTFNEVGAYQSKNSKYYNWYCFDNFPNKYLCWWDIDVLPTINKQNIEFQNFIAGEGGVIEHYLKLGADGFRLDVVDELSSQFVKNIRKRIKKNNKSGILVGEVWEDATNKIAYGTRKSYFLGSELDSVMNYPLKNAIISYLTTKNCNELAYIVREQINNYPKQALDVLMNIVGTHDTERILTVLSAQKTLSTRDEMANYKYSPAEIERGKQLLKLAVLLEFTMYGVPTIYYGDERGTYGFKDPFNRTTINWKKRDNEIFNFYKQIALFRSGEKVFERGELEILSENQGLFAFRRFDESGEVIVVINLNENVYKISLDNEFINVFDKKKAKTFTVDRNSYLLLKKLR